MSGIFHTSFTFAFDGDWRRVRAGENNVLTVAPDGNARLDVRAFQYRFNGVNWVADNVVTITGTDNNNADDHASVGTGLVPTASYLFGFDTVNLTWDRIRSFAEADNLLVISNGSLRVQSVLLGFDGVTYDRLRCAGDDADNVAVETLGILKVGARLLGFDGVTYDRLRSAGDDVASVATESAGVLKIAARMYGLDATNWTRIRADGNGQDNIATDSDGCIQAQGFTYGWDSVGGNYDRVRVGADNADNVATESLGILKVAARLFGFDGSTYDRIESGANNADGVGTSALGILKVLNFPMLWNGSTFDRARRNSAANQSQTNVHAQNVALAGQWSEFHTPAVNTQATCTRAAPGAGQRHVVNTLTFSMVAIGATGVTFTVTLADSSGTRWAQTVRIDTASAHNVNVHITGLAIVGADNSAVTLAFSAAAANVTESVAMTGYTAN